MTAASGAEAAHELFALLKLAAFYAPDSAAFRSRCSEACGALSREPSLEIEARDDELYVDGRRVPPTLGGAAAPEYLLSEFASRGITGLRFSADLDGAGLARFVSLFHAVDPRRGEGLTELRRRAAEAGVSGVEAYGDEGTPARAVEPDAGGAAKRAFFGAMEVLQEVMTRVRDGRETDLAPARRAVAVLVEQVTTNVQALFELTRLRDFDQYTYAHSVDVSVYSIALGLELGLSEPLLRELGFATLFHDIGKARLPQEVVDKPTELDENDWIKLRRHPALGALTLLAQGRSREREWARAISVAFEHHLRQDGGGYPPPRWPRRQDLFSRICAVADSFDAMTSGRVYMRRALGPEEAVRRLLSGAGTAYDPFLVTLFAALVARRPAGAEAGSLRPI